MPAVIETFMWCPSNETDHMEFESSHRSETYIVTLSRHNPGPYSVNWHCTCPGFKFRKDCKHVRKAQELHCGYGVEAVMGSPATEWDTDEKGSKVCPKCGARAVGVRVAV